MVPTYATVKLEFVGILVVEVHTCHLVGCETLATSTPSAPAATARESHVIGVVGVGHEEHLRIVHHHTTKDTACIAFLSTCGEVGIDHDTLVHALLDAEVEHSLFLTILNA